MGDRKIKLLILSYPVWNEKNNSVNTYINLFGNTDRYEVANISTLPGKPYGTVCKRFFNITEKEMLRGLIGKTNAGKEIYQESDLSSLSTAKESNLVKKAKILRLRIFFWIRELIWVFGTWKTQQLDEFIKSFDPDAVVLPIKDTRFFNKLGQYAHRISGKPLIGFVSDDVYSYYGYSRSPLVWLDGAIFKPITRQSILECDLMFTLTEKQKREYDQLFDINCQVITKGGSFVNKPEYNPKKHVKLVYTGNIGAGRWQTLALIGDALKGLDAEMDIYTGTPITPKQKHLLLRSGKVNMKGFVAQSEIKNIQLDADVLVHVESFLRTEKYSGRLSFSTKIVDYLEAHRCILAVGWGGTAAIEYLKEHNAACVITSVEDIKNEITNLISSSAKMKQLSDNGYALGVANHNNDVIKEKLYHNILSIL